MQVLKVLHCTDPRRTPTSQSYTQQSYLEVAMTDMQHRAPGHMSGHAGGWGRPRPLSTLGFRLKTGHRRIYGVLRLRGFKNWR